MWEKITHYLENVSASLKVKEEDSVYLKALKIFMKIISIIFLIAISPLLMVLVMVILMAAS